MDTCIHLGLLVSWSSGGSGACALALHLGNAGVGGGVRALKDHQTQARVPGY